MVGRKRHKEGQMYRYTTCMKNSVKYNIIINVATVLRCLELML